MADFEYRRTEFAQLIVPDHLQELSQTGLEMLETARLETNQINEVRQQPWFDITSDFRTSLVESHYSPQEGRAHWELRNPENPVFRDKIVILLVENSLRIAISLRRDARQWSEDNGSLMETTIDSYNASVLLDARGGQLFERNPVRANHSIKSLEGKDLDLFTEQFDQTTGRLGIDRALDELRQAS